MPVTENQRRAWTAMPSGHNKQPLPGPTFPLAGQAKRPRGQAANVCRFKSPHAGFKVFVWPLRMCIGRMTLCRVPLRRVPLCALCLSSFRSVAVITFASHAKGPRLETGRKHLSL